MSQQTILKKLNEPEVEMVCPSCKYFMESEGLFFCSFYDAFLSTETLCIPCEFQEKNDVPASLYPEK
jgi:hypothetical protein